MADYVAVLESQSPRLASMETELDNFTKLAIRISTLKGHSKLERIVTSTGVMRKDNQTETYVSSLFIEQVERFEDKTARRAHQSTNELGNQPG